MPIIIFIIFHVLNPPIILLYLLYHKTAHLSIEIEKLQEKEDLYFIQVLYDYFEILSAILLATKEYGFTFTSYPDAFIHPTNSGINILVFPLSEFPAST